MAMNEHGEWGRPDINDMVILGAAIIRRHDKGEMTDSTIDKYVTGMAHTYELTEEEARELRQRLVSKR